MNRILVSLVLSALTLTSCAANVEPTAQSQPISLEKLLGLSEEDISSSLQAVCPDLVSIISTFDAGAATQQATELDLIFDEREALKYLTETNLPDSFGSIEVSTSIKKLTDALVDDLVDSSSFDSSAYLEGEVAEAISRAKAQLQDRAIAECEVGDALSSLSVADESLQRVRNLASQAPWSPEGFNEVGNLAWRWSKPSDNVYCDEFNSCYVMFVVSRDGCPGGFRVDVEAVSGTGGERLAKVWASRKFLAPQKETFIEIPTLSASSVGQFLDIRCAGDDAPRFETDFGVQVEQAYFFMPGAVRNPNLTVESLSCADYGIIGSTVRVEIRNSGSQAVEADVAIAYLNSEGTVIGQAGNWATVFPDTVTRINVRTPSDIFSFSDCKISYLTELGE